MLDETRFKETEIGLIPEDWEIKRISELVKINESNIGKSFEYDTIEYIDIASVDKGRITELNEIELVDAPSRAKRIINDNDILISTVRPNLKHYTYIYKSKPNLIASTGFAVISAKKINSRFLYYYLTTKYYTDYLTSIADSHTSAYPSFNPDIIENSFIPYPSEPEQEFIANILYSLDNKIELNHKMNQTLEAIGQAIFNHWFIDFEFPDKDGKPYKSSGGEMVNSELGKIPEGWEVGNLGKLISISSGKRPTKKSDAKDSEFKIPLIGASCLMGFVKESLYNEPVLIIGRVGTHGVVQRVNPPLFPSDNTLVIKSRFYEYVHQILKRIDYESLNVGTTQPLITQTSIKNYEIILPPENILMAFEEIISKLFKKIDSNNIESETLSQIRDSLLPKLMSGKMRIPNYQNQIEDETKNEKRGKTIT